MLKEIKIIILAAGRGSRVNRLTKKKPKTLIKISDKSILDYHLIELAKLGIKNKQISIITGYERKAFSKYKIKKFVNKSWKSTNMVYSLTKADHWLKNYNCIVIYGDVLYEHTIINKLKKNINKFCLASNINWKKYWKQRFIDPIKDLESFKTDQKKLIIEIGQKVKSINEIRGQFMGIFKIDPSNWLKFKKKLKESNYKISTTELLNKLIKEEKVKIKSIDYKKYWFEIDTYKDFKIANKFFKNLI